MASPLEATSVSPPGPREDWNGPLGDAGWGLAWLDYGVYSVERIIVVVSLIAMTIVEFIYILSLYITEQTITFKRMSDPELESEFPLGLLVLLAFVYILMFAVASRTPLGRTADGKPRSLAIRASAAFGFLVALAGIAYLTSFFEESKHFYLVLVSLIMLPSVWYFWTKKLMFSTVIVGIFTVIAYIAAWYVPSGYSWADKRALFLLLWVGFLGASMAAKQKRHITIDAFRKAVPQKFLPKYNGISLLVAAAFTGLLVYIGGIYLFNEDYGRFWANTIPGEIPDWLKVGSIPIAFLLMTLRFTAQGVTLLVWGEQSEPQTGPVSVPEPEKPEPEPEKPEPTTAKSKAPKKRKKKKKKGKKR